MTSIFFYFKIALKSLGYTQDPRDLQPPIGKKDDVLVIAAQKKAQAVESMREQVDLNTFSKLIDEVLGVKP